MPEDPFVPELPEVPFTPDDPFVPELPEVPLVPLVPLVPSPPPPSPSARLLPPSITMVVPLPVIGAKPDRRRVLSSASEPLIISFLNIVWRPLLIY